MSSPNDPFAGLAAEFRRDLRGDLVVISPGRARRPNDFAGGGRDSRAACPFCPGREPETPPEVDAIRPDGSSPDTPGWRVRVFPNKYPAFPREPDPANPRAAWGVHEVIVESTDHDRGLADLSAGELTDVLTIYQRRLRAARADSRIAYGTIFKNSGVEAGASLVHSHSQLKAIGFVPRRIAEEAEAHRRGAFARRLVTADYVARSARVVAFSPADARLPYEVWLTPSEAEERFEEAGAATIADAAAVLGRLLRAMNAIANRPPYHLLVHTAPFRGGARFRWRIEIVPRLARIAGFELAAGVFINQVSPEEAGRRYREALGSAAGASAAS